MTEVSALRLLACAGLTAAALLDGALALSPYTVWCLSVPMILWCAAPFHGGLTRALREQRANSDMLISIGAWAAFGESTAAVFAPQLLHPGAREPRLGAMGLLITISIFGRWLEFRLTERSGEALGKLLRRIPRSCKVERAGAEELKPAHEVRPGDRVVVRPGELVPVDGEVVSGAASVDESLWTGVLTPAVKSAGSKVFAGGQNKDGTLLVETRRAGSDTGLARLIESICAGFATKSARAPIADRIASGYVPAIVMVAVAASFLWSWQGNVSARSNAFGALAEVLFAAAPWAMDLAAPMALAVGLRQAARMGIRIRNPEVLQRFETPDVLLVDEFDDPLKTGVREGIAALKGRGIEVVLASGDSNAAAYRAAEAAGIGRVYAEVADGEKVKIVTHLQSLGKKVVMIGEGIRDAAALSHADLGIAVGQGGEAGRRDNREFGAGIDLAAEAADMILSRRDIGHLVAVLELGLRIRRAIVENLRWAFGLHVLLLPFAAGVLEPWFGFRLPTGLIGAAAGLSIAAIVANSWLRLRAAAPKNHTA